MNDITCDFDNRFKIRQNQLNYQNFLKQQIEDKRRREEDERRLRREEEIKIEEEFNKLLEKEKKTSNIAGFKRVNKRDNFKVKKNIPIYPQIQKQISIHINPPVDNMLHSTNLCLDYKNFKENYITNEAERMNLRDYYLQNYLMELTKPILERKNLNNNNNRDVKELGQSSMVENICRTFFSEQTKLIQQYMNRVQEVMKERDDAFRESLLMKEKLLIMNQIRHEHEKIKESLGSVEKSEIREDFTRKLEKNLVFLDKLLQEKFNQSNEMSLFNKKKILKKISIESTENNEILPFESKFLKITPKQSVVNEYKNYYETWRINDEAVLDQKDGNKETDKKEENPTMEKQHNLYHKTKPKSVGINNKKNDSTFNVNNIEKLEEYLLSPSEQSFMKPKQENEYISTNDNQTQDQVDIKSNSNQDSAKIKPLVTSSPFGEPIIDEKKDEKKGIIPVYLKSPVNKNSAKINKGKNKFVSTPKQATQIKKTLIEKKVHLNKQIGHTIIDNDSIKNNQDSNKGSELELLEIPYKLSKVQESVKNIKGRDKISNIKQSLTVKNSHNKGIYVHKANKSVHLDIIDTSPSREVDIISKDVFSKYDKKLLLKEKRNYTFIEFEKLEK